MDASLVPEGNPRLSPTRFVKVFLHGEPFGRKINLSAHNSYDSLSFTLKRLGNNYSLTQYQLSGLVMNEEESAIDDDFMFLYDNMEGYRFFLGEVPWEDFTVSVKKIYILPGEKQDENDEYLEEGDGDNGDGNAAGADGDDDATGEDGALDAVVAEDDGDEAEDEGDEAAGEVGDGAYDDEDEAVGDDGDDASAEGNDGGAAE